MSDLRITKLGERLFVEGPSLIPGEVDQQHEVADEDEVRLAMYSWMHSGHPFKLMHESDIDGDDVVLVEARLLRSPEKIGGRELPVGTWVTKAEILSPQLKRLVADKQLRGFSIGGFALSEE